MKLFRTTNRIPLVFYWEILNPIWSFLDYRLHPGLAIFNCATSSFSGARILQCVSATYVELSTSCCLSWKATLVPSLNLIYWSGSYNLPLHHSLAWCRCCLIASSWNLLANVSDHLQHFDFFRDVNYVHDEKYPPCLRWFLLSSTTPLTSFHRELVHITTCSLASVVFCLEVLLSFMSRMLWELLNLLEILSMMILLIITVLPWSPRCF